MTDPILGWWFAAVDTLPHDDGRKIVIGETHTVEPPIVLCKHALHFCRRPWQALQFAPGPYLYQVRCEGVIVEDDEKGGCSERTYLAMRDTTEVCRTFARSEALRVIHLWDAPAVVREYLETGREDIRAAARDAARDAARNAAWAAARDAAWDAARDAAWAAARDAAWAAAWAAAGDAAGDAARDAAGDAARDASGERFNAAIADLFI